MNYFRQVGIISMALLLSSCHTTSSQQVPAQDFVIAASALLQAESGYMDEIQQASDASYRLGAAEQYVAHDGKWKEVAQSLKQHNDFSKAKELRVKMLESLVTYAQMVNVLACDGDTAWLEKNAQETTGTISDILQDSGAAHVSDSQKGAVESVIATFGHSIIDNAAAGKVHKLAEMGRQPIAGIRKMIEADDEAIEGSLFAAGLEKDQQSSRKNMLHSIYEDKSVNAAERLQAFTSVEAIETHAVTRRKDILSALKKLEAANDALAAGNNLSARALAQQAIAYADLAAQVHKTAIE
ncbi:MAG TPA: hypothetical protein VFT64_04925 [Rickettsiales bacterium]|nr:hypothetical protein [Rickettsiales bacterium]